MRPRIPVLTEEERDVLIASELHLDGRHPSYREVAQHLGLSVSKVKTLMHQAFVKLGAYNRGEAFVFALKRGEITLHETHSLDELAELSLLLGSDALRKLARLLRLRQEGGLIPGEDEYTVPAHRKPGAVLTDRERDILILVGRGLSNREIADSLHLSPRSVGTMLSRASKKLGAHRRYDALTVALKQGEISTGEVCTVGEMLRMLGPLGADAVDEVADLLEAKLGRGPASAAE